MVMPIKDKKLRCAARGWRGGRPVDQPPCQPPRQRLPELSDRPRRRTFTVGDKLRFLAEIDRAPAGGTGAVRSAGRAVYVVDPEPDDIGMLRGWRARCERASVDEAEARPRAQSDGGGTGAGQTGEARLVRRLVVPRPWSPSKKK